MNGFRRTTYPGLRESRNHRVLHTLVLFKQT